MVGHRVRGLVPPAHPLDGSISVPWIEPRDPDSVQSVSSAADGGAGDERGREQRQQQDGDAIQQITAAMRQTITARPVLE